jgi:hypothetical protein
MRQQSIRYASGYVQELDFDVFEHWDSRLMDHLTMDPRIAGRGELEAKMYEFHTSPCRT